MKFIFFMQRTKFSFQDNQREMSERRRLIALCLH
jgi:hypothetical protein